MHVEHRRSRLPGREHLVPSPQPGLTRPKWRIGYVIGPVKSWHVQEGGDYSVREPAPAGTNHIEIIPFEASTGRIVPDVPIRLELLDTTGNVVQAQDLTFYWSDFVHYANNFSVPAPGRYTLRATLGAPAFLRHEHGGHGGTPTLPEGTTVEFTDVGRSPRATDPAATRRH